MEEFAIVDFKEGYDGGKLIIKLTKKQLSQLSSGRMLFGFNIKVGLEVEDGE